MAALSFAVYRIHLMGLLPTHLSDWVAVVQTPKLLDRAVGSPSWTSGGIVCVFCKLYIIKSIINFWIYIVKR